MSQRELAVALNRSEGWVSQVERGVQPVNRLPVFQAIASALGASLEDLRPEAASVAQEQKKREIVEATRPNDLDGVRLTLSEYPIFSASKNNIDTTELETSVNHAWELAHNNHYTELSELLTDLIPKIERAVREAKQPADHLLVHQLKTQVYQVASAVFTRQGESDAAWIAADRAISAAEQIDDSLSVFAGCFRLAHSFLRAKRLEQAERVTTATLQSIERYLKNQQEVDEPALSLKGSLHLVQAVLGARLDQRDLAKSNLASAEDLAEQLTGARNDYGTEFGLTNVRLHQISIAVELGDAGEALQIASKLNVQSLSAERQARFWLDVACAHIQRKQEHSALDALEKAESLSPEYVRGHQYARDAIQDLLRFGRKNNSRLLELAERANVSN